VEQDVVFSGTFTIAPANESAFRIFSDLRQAMLFTSVMVKVGPGLGLGLGEVTWREFFVVKEGLHQIGTPPIIDFARGIRVKNENPSGGPSITIEIQAIEIAQD
jgi:hypothetical protein